MQSLPELPEILTAKEAAKALGVSYNTMRIWREKNRGPEYIQRGYSRFFYRKEALVKFAEEFNYDLQV